MTKNIKFVGLDVHAATVAIAAAEVGSNRRVLGKLGKKELGVECIVGCALAHPQGCK